MTTMTVTMRWTREKALEMLSDDAPKDRLERMSDKELFDMGLQLSYWHIIPGARHPLDYRQLTLSDFMPAAEAA